MEIINFRKEPQSDKDHKGGSCVRSYVIIPRCDHGLQDPFHKTPRPYLRTYPRSWRGAIQSCDVAHSSSVELTQWSGSLTRLASDLWSGAPKVRMYHTLIISGLRHSPPPMKNQCGSMRKKNLIGPKKRTSQTSASDVSRVVSFWFTKNLKRKSFMRVEK